MITSTVWLLIFFDKREWKKKKKKLEISRANFAIKFEMSSNGTPGYLNALQVCGAILTMVLFGAFWRLVKIAPESTVIAVNQFVFFVGIPCTVFQGLAIQKFSSLRWDYIVVFLCLRISLALLWMLVCALIPSRRRIGTYVADYMNSTWINTVIFGVPIMQALYGPTAALYAILASISSFFFQLPYQLILFEISSALFPPPTTDVDIMWKRSSLPVAHPHLTTAARLARALAMALFVNPILLAIGAGIAWSFLAWPIPVYLDTIITFCGNAVTPMAAWSIGVFMVRPIPRNLQFWLIMLVYLIVKIFIMPLLVMPFLLAFNVTGGPAQMGVLMAALPVALSCYIFSVRYGENEEEAAWMVILSTILMLPVELMWIAIINSMSWGKITTVVAIVNATNSTNVTAIVNGTARILQ